MAKAIMRRALALLLVTLGVLGATRLWMHGEGSVPVSPAQPVSTQPGAVPPAPSITPVTVAEHLEERRASVVPPKEAVPPTPPTTASAFPVSGVVLDEAGLPISDAEVFIGAEKNPFGEDQATRSAQWDNYTGRLFSVGANGEFRADLPSAQQVLVWADGSRRTVEWISELESQAWVTPPREDLVLRLRHVPYGTLVVRVHDAVLGSDLERFDVSLSSEGKSFMKVGTTEGVREIVVPKILEGGRTYTVRLVSPKTEKAVQETLHLANGETREVLLQVHSDRTAGGVVTDSAGVPIEGALVYFGDLPSEPGDAPNPSRTVGVHTDIRGQFQLSGSSSVVSFWHRRYQPRTLPASEGMNVALDDRGRIVGRLEEGLDPASVRLDEDATPEVQPDGSFVFEDVAAGLHLVQLPGGQLLSVILISNETVEIGQGDRVEDVVLRLHSASQPLEGEIWGSLLGLQPVASGVVFTAIDGTASVGGVIPGDYLLTFARHVSIVSIDRSEVLVDVGEHRLTVHSAGGGSFVLLPSDASIMPEQVRNLLAQSVAAGSELEFGPLPSGTYVLMEMRSGHEWKVELDGSRALDLP